MSNNHDTRRLIALIFCISAGLTSLIISAFKDGSNVQPIFIGVTVASMGAVILLVSEKVKKWLILFASILQIDVENNDDDSSTQAPVVKAVKINRNTTLSGSDPSLPGVILPSKVAAARQTIHSILTGESVQNTYLEVLTFIDALERSVRNHWVMALTRGAMLVHLKLFVEAEKIGHEVVAKYSNCRQAVGMAHSLLAWVIEVNMPAIESAEYEKCLKTRTFHLTEGLANYPERHSLQMSGFEVFVLNGIAEKCVMHLTTAVQIDEKSTQKKLKALKGGTNMIKRAQDLSPELDALIESILKEEKRQRHSELLKTVRLASSVLALLAVMLISLLGISDPEERRSHKYASAGILSRVYDLGDTQAVVKTGEKRLSTLFAGVKGHDVFSIAAKGHDVHALVDRNSPKFSSKGFIQHTYELVTSFTFKAILAITRDVIPGLPNAEGHDVRNSLILAKGHDVRC